MIGTGIKETMSEHHNYSPAAAGSGSGQRQHLRDDAQPFGHLPPVLPPLGPPPLQIDLSGMSLQSVTVDTPAFSIPTPEPVAAEDQQLVQQCLQGDQAAWSRLIDKYKRLIYSVPIKYGFRPEDASDIFQTVCIDLFTNLCNLRKVGSLRSWLITVTSHKCFHWKRQQRQDVELDALEQEIAEDLAAAPEIIEELQQEQIVRDAVDRLPPRCAEMVRLLFFEQPSLPYAEVAKRLGLAVGSIGFIRGRCLTRLHKILMELGF
jgi:RNA polymerase sigma factor (sigma-70 family)